MLRYKRWPAVLILAVFCSAGWVYLLFSGRHAAGESLAALEEKIAGGADTAEVWQAYAERLAAASPPRYSAAAQAFRRVLEKDPSRREARIGRAVALAQAAESDELAAYLRDLIYTWNDPRLAMELLERRECRPFMGEARFIALQADAKAQAMD